MKFRYSHVTTYEYGDPVMICHNAVHMTARTTVRQENLRSHVHVEPAPAVRRQRDDFFGNPTTFFTIQERHNTLKVTADGEVDVEPAETPDPASTPTWESVRDRLKRDLGEQSLGAFQFAFSSPYVPRLPELRSYAMLSFTKGRPLLDAVLDLNRRIHAEFRYESGSSTIATPVIDVFRERCGVCQDFAHLEIGCLRALGIPARYVSGYLLTTPPPGKKKLVGADASHAWVSVYCPGQGWIDVDPTNNKIASEEHITVAWGRDYGDVSPIKGVIIGGGAHEAKVAVDVTPIL